MNLLKRKKKYKSVITARILKSSKRAGLVLFLFFFAVNLGKVLPTNSAYYDTETSSGNTMSAGVWIPTLTKTVDPDTPDGPNGFYTSSPCIKLFSDIDDVTIHYSFTGDNPGSGTIAEDTCLSAPLGENDFSAWAVNNANSSWVSSTITDHFKVGDMVDPVVEILSLDDGDTWTNNAYIHMKFTDSFPKSYSWSITKDSTGTVVQHGDDISQTTSVNDKSIYQWTTRALVGGGNYTIRVEGEDQSGNTASDSVTVFVEDTMSPRLMTFDFSPKIIDTSLSEKQVVVTYRLTDDYSGVNKSSSFVRFSSPSLTQSEQEALNSANTTRISGDDLDGTYETTLTFPAYKDQPFPDLGTWKAYFNSVDQEGNSNFLTPAILKTKGFPTELEILDPEDIVLNEILPDPTGADNSDKASSEFIEIYNNGDYDMDLNGWRIYYGPGSDPLPSNFIEVNSASTDGSGTVIHSQDFLTIYFYTKYGSSALNNTEGIVNLHPGTGTSPVDSYHYTGVIENKSYARIPDGTGAWVDPIPTPNAPNKTEDDDKEIEETAAVPENTPLQNDAPEISNPTDDAGSGNGGNGDETVSGGNNSQNSDSGFDETNTDSVDQSTGADNNKEPEEPKIISKTFDVKISGKLDVPDGFEAEWKQEMKKIELSGEEKAINDLKDFEVDLSEIKITGKDDKMKILVSDLDISKDFELVDAKKDDAVVLITVTEKPKEEPKKDEIKKADATVPKADSPKNDDKKDNSKGDGGDGGDGSASQQ